MAKKISAYAKNKQGEYILNQHKPSQLKKFYIWNVLKMKQESPAEYEKLTFYSTQADKQYRARMTPVKNGFFRYIENMKGGNNEDGDNESISHSTAISVLSELSEITFVIGKKSYQLKFTEFLIEPRLQFENRNVYYPDLIGCFSSKCDLAEKWNGKVAIEVAVNHKCEQTKIKDFFAHNIPIIEVTLTKKMIFLKEFQNKSYDSEDLEKYYDFLKSKFKDHVYGNILSDPIPANYYVEELKLKQIELNNIISINTELNESNESYKLELDKKQSLLNEFTTKINDLSRENYNLHNLLKQNEESNKKLKNKIETIESMSFWEKLRYLFKLD